MLDAVLPSRRPAASAGLDGGRSRGPLVLLAAATLVSLALVLGLLTAAGLPLAASATNRAEERVQHTMEVLLEAGHLLGALRDAETGQRGYLLTLDAEYLAPYEAGRMAARQHFAELLRLTSDNRSQERRLAQLERVIDDKLEELARTVAYARAGLLREALAIVRGNEGRLHMQEVRRLAEELRAEEEHLLAGRRATAEAADAALRRDLWFGSGVALLATLAGVGAFLVLVRQRHQAKAAARLRGLIEGTPVPMWIKRPDGTPETFNAAWRGYTGQAVIQGDQAWDTVIHPEEREAAAAARRQATEALAPYEIDLRLRRAADGAWRWHRVRVAPLLADEGGAAAWAWVGTASDVHDLREAEAVLAEREARLRSVVDTAADGIVVASGDGRIVSANPAAARMFRFAGDAEGMVGRELGLLMPKAEAERHGGYLSGHHSTGRARAIGVSGRQLMGRRRDGEEFPIELSVSSFVAGGERFLTGVIRDVTARVEAAAAAARQAHRRGLLLEISRAILAEEGNEVALTEAIFKRVAPFLAADFCLHWALEQRDQVLRLVAAPGCAPDCVQEGQIADLSEIFCGEVVRTAQAFSVDEATIASDPRGASLRAMGITAYTCQPLFGRNGGLLGTFAFAATGRAGFDSEELEFLQTLSHLVALAVQQRRAEAALRESEAFGRSVLRSTTDCMAVLDEEGRLRFMNEPGRCQKEIDDIGPVLGRPVDSLWPEESQPRVRAALDAARQGQAARYTAYGPTAKGTPKWWDVTVTPLPGAPGEPPRILSVARDITEAYCAEQDLRDERAFLSSVLDASTDCVKVVERDGSLTFMNANGRCLMEIDDFDVIKGAEWAALWPEDGQDKVRQAVATALTGRDARFEAFCPTAKGTPKWWDVAVAPVLDASGRVARLVSASRDVTKRKKVEADLRAAEALAQSRLSELEQIYRYAPVGLFNLDRNLRFTRINERMADINGLPAEAQVGKNLWEVVPDLADHLADIYAPVMERGEPRLEVPIHGETAAAPGVKRDWIASYFPMRSATGEIDGLIGTVLEVTGRKRAERELAESVMRLRFALEAGRMGIWDWDLTADRLTWDARQFELFGLVPVEGPFPAAEALVPVHEADRPVLEAAIRRALESADGGYSAEFRVVLPGGGTRWIGAHGHAVRDSDGGTRRMVGLNFDISDRKEAEAVLARSREELERLVEERTAELRQSQARLAEAARMEALGRLAGGIAHDFNNVLQAVHGGIALARKRIGHDLGGATPFLDLALESTERGAAITGRLLSFARRGKLVAAPVEPAPMLEGLAAMLKHTLGPQVALRVDVAPGTPAMLADQGQLEAVLVNLANNARDAMPERGGTVRFGATVAQAPAGLPSASYVRLTVGDDGHGMTPEVLERITEPFFTTKPKGKGTGLGLAMASGFAEQSGGALSIDSAPGVGTTISLWLPLAPETPAVEPLQAAVESGAAVLAPRMSLLVVDDEPGVRSVLASALGDNGHLVAEAEDGRSAMAAIEGGAPLDALVTDLAMPGGMDGLALIREARRRRPGLPAVLVTGHVGDATRGALAEAAGTGPFAILRKPIAAEAVEAQVAVLLQDAR